MQFTNNTNVPIPLALWLAVDEYQYAKTANEISATTLLRSPRYIIGTRRMMYPEQFDSKPESVSYITQQLLSESNVLPDIIDRLASRIGTAIHASVEEAWSKPELRNQGLKALGYPDEVINRIKFNEDSDSSGSNSIVIKSENRLYKPIDRFIISGQYDSIVDGQLHDIKTTKTYSWVSGCNDQKYMQQGSIYRWLDPELIKSDSVCINFIFTDWSKQRVFDQGYPQAPICGKEYQLMSYNETEMFIQNKIDLLNKYWNEPLEVIPCCTPQELYSSPPVYKYYANGAQNSTRSTRNFATLAEASKYRAKKGHIGDIIEYRGTPFTCPFCLPDEVEQTISIPVVEESIKFK